MPARSESIQYERDVRPIIAANCVGCHGADKPKGGLDLRSVASMLRGGKSGPALEPSDPEDSLLLERIAQGEMPPGKARKLSAPGGLGRSRTGSGKGPAPITPRPVRSRSLPSAMTIGGSGRFGRSGGRRFLRSRTSSGCGHPSTPSCSRGWSRRA